MGVRYKYLADGIYNPVWVAEQEREQREREEAEERRRSELDAERSYQRSLNYLERQNEMNTNRSINLAKAKIALIDKYKDHPNFKSIEKIIMDIR